MFYELNTYLSTIKRPPDDLHRRWSLIFYFRSFRFFDLAITTLTKTFSYSRDSATLCSCFPSPPTPSSLILHANSDRRYSLGCHHSLETLPFSSRNFALSLNILRSPSATINPSRSRLYRFISTPAPTILYRQSFCTLPSHFDHRFPTLRSTIPSPITSPSFHFSCMTRLHIIRRGRACWATICSLAPTASHAYGVVSVSEDEFLPRISHFVLKKYGKMLPAKINQISDINTRCSKRRRSLVPHPFTSRVGSKVAQHPRATFNPPARTATFFPALADSVMWGTFSSLASFLHVAYHN